MRDPYLLLPLSNKILLLYQFLSHEVVSYTLNRLDDCLVIFDGQFDVQT